MFDYRLCGIVMTKEEKKKKDLEATKRFKEKYFEYYDDIKTHTVSKYDW